MDELYCTSKMVIGRPQYFHHNTIAADKQQWTEYNILYGFGSGWYLSSFLSQQYKKLSNVIIISLVLIVDIRQQLQQRTMATNVSLVPNGVVLGNRQQRCQLHNSRICVGGPGEMKLGQLSC